MSFYPFASNTARKIKYTTVGVYTNTEFEEHLTEHRLQYDYKTAGRTLKKSPKNSTFLSAHVQAELASTYSPKTITEMNSSTGIVSTYLLDLLLSNSVGGVLHLCERKFDELEACYFAIANRLEALSIPYVYSEERIKTKLVTVLFYNDNKFAPRNSDVTLWDPMWDNSFEEFITGEIFDGFSSCGHVLKSPRRLTFKQNNFMYPIYTHSVDKDNIHVMNGKGICGSFSKKGKVYMVERKVVLAPPNASKDIFRFGNKKCLRKPGKNAPRIKMKGAMRLEFSEKGHFYAFADQPSKEDFKTTHLYRTRAAFIKSKVKFEPYPGWKDSKAYIKFLGFCYGEKDAEPKPCAHPRTAWLADLSPFVYISKLPVRFQDLLLVYPGHRDVNAVLRFNGLCDKHKQEHLKINLTQWQPDRASRDVELNSIEPEGTFDVTWFNEVYHGLGTDSNINIKRALAHSQEIHITGVRYQNAFGGVVAMQPYLRQFDDIISYVGSDEDYVTPRPSPYFVPGTHEVEGKKILSVRKLASEIFPNYFNVEIKVVEKVLHAQEPTNFWIASGIERIEASERLYFVDIECLNKFSLSTSKKIWTQHYARHLQKRVMETMLEGPNARLYALSVRINADGILEKKIENSTVCVRVALDTVDWLLIGSKSEEEINTFRQTCINAAKQVNILKETMESPWQEREIQYLVSPEEGVVVLLVLAFVVAVLPWTHMIGVLFAVALVGKLMLTKRKRNILHKAIQEDLIEFEVFDWTLLW